METPKQRVKSVEARAKSMTQSVFTYLKLTMETPMCEICLKLTTKTPELRQHNFFGVSIVDLEQVIAAWGTFH